MYVMRASFTVVAMSHGLLIAPPPPPGCGLCTLCIQPINVPQSPHVAYAPFPAAHVVTADQ
mgnify:CR=1 FL=1